VPLRASERDPVFAKRITCARPSREPFIVLDYNEAVRLAPEDGGLFVERRKTLRSHENSSKQYPTSPTRWNSVRNGRPHTESEG
jgi:hypothetical protein